VKILGEEFFEKDAVSLARDLLGKYVVFGGFVGRVVETEAYHEDDPASHSFLGKSFRNAVMFGKSGVAYVYFIYGMHHCFNVVCGGSGRGEAVLIRAVEPIEGVDEMKKNRRVDDIKNLCNGPAKFCQAFGISRMQNGTSLADGKGIYFCEDFENGGKPRTTRANTDFEVVATTRIGISKGVDLPYRFYIKGNLFVSRG